MRPPESSPASACLSTYNAGPFVAGAALAAFESGSASCHIPVGTGDTELLRAIDALEAVVLTPSYAAYLASHKLQLQHI